MCQTYFHISNRTWNIGQTISHEDYKDSPHKTFFVLDPETRLRAIEDYMARRASEFLLEELRPHHLPSRAEAFFLCSDLEGVRFWDTGMRKGGTIYELKPVEVIGKHVGSVTWFNYMVRLQKNQIQQESFVMKNATSQEELLASGNAYRSGNLLVVGSDPPRLEVIFKGTLEIVAKHISN